MAHTVDTISTSGAIGGVDALVATTPSVIDERIIASAEPVVAFPGTSADIFSADRRGGGTLRIGDTLDTGVLMAHDIQIVASLFERIASGDLDEVLVLVEKIA